MENTLAIPRTHAKRNTSKHAVRLLIPFSSTRKATPTSMREMLEVMAATTTEKKNSTATMVPIIGYEAPIPEKTCGRVS